MENTDWRDKQFQWMGVLPLLIFLYRLIQYISVGTPDWIMYNCHLSTLLLAVAMLTSWKPGIRIAAIWLVIGLPMWLIDAWVTQVIWVASIVSHLGGFLLAIYAIRKVRATGKSWLPALAWFLFWQLVTRYTTVPELNVNIAHMPYEACKSWFANYWQFWPVGALVAGLMVYGVEFGLWKLYPLQKVESTDETAYFAPAIDENPESVAATF
ncbi:MAG: hypothetical protein IPJ07_13125 [Acidobacteria bacterium]|nr:hypothetical protein [Acidobacteriota bacterium]